MIEKRFPMSTCFEVELLRRRRVTHQIDFLGLDLELCGHSLKLCRRLAQHGHRVLGEQIGRLLRLAVRARSLLTE